MDKGSPEIEGPGLSHFPDIAGKGVGTTVVRAEMGSPAFRRHTRRP